MTTECTCGHGQLWHEREGCAVWACYCETYEVAIVPTVGEALWDYWYSLTREEQEHVVGATREYLYDKAPHPETRR